MKAPRQRANDIEPTYEPMSKQPVIRRGSRIACAEDVYRYLADVHSADREHFIAIDLDARHRVIEKRIVAIGTITGVECHPREVFRPAVTNGAVAMIVAHNHPSGDPSPSRQDIELTGRLRDVGELLGIPVIDHLVIVDGGYHSFADSGWR